MEDNQMETNDGKLKGWLQDNLRIIVSIVVVVAIAGGIYSYSKRSAIAPVAQDEKNEVAEVIIEEPKEESGEQEVAKVEEKKTEQTETRKEETKEEAPKEIAKEQVTSESTSRETESAFIEVAQRGEGKTHLARRALANYLEKNPDSELTKEHKIFIEDYLRKKNTSVKNVRIGTSMEFSKDMVQEAISKSKQLNERQLNNLRQFSQRVPSLS